MYMFFIAVGGGILSALVRFIMFVIASTFTIVRLDQSLLAQWVVNFMNLDGQNVAYLSTVLTYHLHNHPVFITAANILGK